MAVAQFRGGQLMAAAAIDVGCDHVVDETTIELDCEPTNEWIGDCRYCSAVLMIQSETRPHDTDDWRAV